jgi:endonuclease/exonuclease/phosphatase family metal-dependent hydrolase
MPALRSSTAFVPSRIALTAIALMLAVLGFAAVSAVNTPPAAAAQNFQAQAKKKCKKVKSAAAKRRCVRATATRLRRQAAARARAIARRDRGKVGVMTRNLYLGADLGPAISANSLQAFINANGEIMRDVDTNNFPVRARGLAAEIKTKSPDLVGLQEVSLWRTGPAGPPRNKPASPPESFTATTVKYDYLDLLMKELNKGKQRYRVVHVTTEFDFEGPANYDNDEIGIGELNGRLTMRDVILAKVGSDIKTRNATGANYSTYYNPVISGLPVAVDRGWGSVEVKVRNSPWFKFVNTHFEAFGDDKNKVVDCMTDPAPGFESNPVSVRCAQAKELYEVAIEPGNLPVVLTGDLNSHDTSVVDANCPSASNLDDSLVGNNGGLCGDTFAFNSLKTNGLVARSTSNPMSCCTKTDILTADNGSPSDFDHHIDHIMTDAPSKVRMLNSSVSGLLPVNGFWNSDHAGVYSLLRVNP